LTQAPPGAPPRPGQPPLRPLRAALSLFTIIPVGAGREISREEAGRALRWLPLAGLLVALPAAGVELAAEGGGRSPAHRLLAATLAVGVMAVLTGGLHLDGLADTADGLASRRSRGEALAIMRRPETGPLGVAALILVLLVQVTALATLGPGRIGPPALLLAAVTGRVAVLLAAGPGSPAAHPEGFGALVAGTVSTRVRVIAVTVLLAAATAGGYLLNDTGTAARWLAAAAAGLLVGGLLRRAALRQLGGITGDVFGALIEIGTATVLTVLALANT
jgi:adenosylcobinamide-GDP ribazoletransferase